MRFKRSLIVLKNYLGDSVMASPPVRAVDRLSEATDILGTPAVEQVLRFPDFRARFHNPANLSRPSQFFKAVRMIREGHYDVAVIVNRSFRSALAVRMGGTKIRAGHATEGRGFLLTHRVAYDLDRNEAECYLDLLRALGDLPDDLDTTPRLWCSDEELARGRELVSGATVGIQPGARHDYKQIPTPILREVCEALISRGKRLVFLGGPEEKSLIEKLQVEGVNLVGKTSLRETMAAMAGLETMIGGDTGVMHLAAGIGCPTVTVFGPTQVQKWGWFTSPHQVIQAPDKDISKIDAETILQACERSMCV